MDLQVVKTTNLAALAIQLQQKKSGLRNWGPPQTKVPVAAADQGLLRGPVESALAETRNGLSLRERDRWRSLSPCSGNFDSELDNRNMKKNMKSLFLRSLL